MAFRDDREALLGRVAALEAELGREREGGAARRELEAQLDSLAGQVRAATGELEQDRAALLEVGAALERLRQRVSPAAPRAPAAPAPSAASAPAAPEGSARFVILGLAVALAALGLVLVLAQADRESASPPPRAPVESDEARQARIARAAEETINSQAFMPFSCDITSEPAGAEVVHRDLIVGKTPLRLELGHGDSLRNYRVQLAGHDHAWLDIPNQLFGCKLHVELRALPASR